MLACATRRSEYQGVSVNLAALDHFRQEDGDFVGLMNSHFKAVVPIAKLDSIRRYEGEDFIVVRPADIGLEVAVEDTTPCGF